MKHQETQAKIYDLELQLEHLDRSLHELVKKLERVELRLEETIDDAKEKLSLTERAETGMIRALQARNSVPLFSLLFSLCSARESVRADCLRAQDQQHDECTSSVAAWDASGPSSPSCAPATPHARRCVVPASLPPLPTGRHSCRTALSLASVLCHVAFFAYPALTHGCTLTTPGPLRKEKCPLRLLTRERAPCVRAQHSEL